MLAIPIQPALETPSANFAGSDDYGLTSYVKAAEWMYLLEQEVGREKVDKAFQHYFTLWRFKHPQPMDLKAAFEQATGENLTRFFNLLNKQGKLTDPE
jgi:aminopeptidase N